MLGWEGTLASPAPLCSLTTWRNHHESSHTFIRKYWHTALTGHCGRCRVFLAAARCWFGYASNGACYHHPRFGLLDTGESRSSTVDDDEPRARLDAQYQPHRYLCCAGPEMVPGRGH